MRAILPVLACLLLTACGLKDDLYLPDPASSEPTQQPAQQPTQQPIEEDERAEDA